MARLIPSMCRGLIHRQWLGYVPVATLGVCVALLVFALWSLADSVAPVHGKDDDLDRMPDRQPATGYGGVETGSQTPDVPAPRTTY